MAERRKFTDYEKKTVYARGNGRCGICGKPIDYEHMTVDHKIPLSKGGTNDFSNLQPACGTCNLLKSALTMPELMERLAKEYPSPVGELFDRCRRGMEELGEHSLAEIWRSALSETALDLDGRASVVLDELGEVLGRFEETGLRTALEHAGTELAREAELAREDGEKRGRMYRVLGFASGGLLVILLL